MNDINVDREIARKEVEQFAIRRHNMMMNASDMMMDNEKKCKDCAKIINSRKHDINGGMASMSMNVKDLGINAPQNEMIAMGGQ